jgi:hypothetical protein
MTGQEDIEITCQVVQGGRWLPETFVNAHSRFRTPWMIHRRWLCVHKSDKSLGVRITRPFFRIFPLSPAGLNPRPWGNLLVFTIPDLVPGDSYVGPTGSSDASDLCKCNTVVYSLMSACDACQDASWFSYVFFLTNPLPLPHSAISWAAIIHSFNGVRSGW